MKLSGYILIILMVGFCFALVGSIVNDFETYYPEVDVNTSTWENEYNYQEKITGNATILQEMLEKMNKEDTHWLFVGLIGVAAIPVAVITAILTIISSLGYGVTILTGVANEIDIPDFVIPFAITAISVIMIWGLISWWRSRSKV